jgi:threonine/homoserine/homoserine lactone efflux protein
MAKKDAVNRQGRAIALVIAGTGVYWIIATALGQALDLNQRLRALLDLIALGGFIWAFWMIYGLWRARQNDEG